MKNVHVIPTEKASKGKLVKGKNLHFYKDGLSKEYLDIDEEFQHIYITDDSEIKEGDWCLGMDGIFQYKGKVNLPDVELPKKIILTTDQDLIADGVQAIDDDFLEWFVKNPTCESVEVKNISIKVVKGYNNNGEIDCYYTNGYEIILPQEEPKQEMAGKAFYESADKVIVVKRQERLKDIELEEVFGSSHCQFSVIENSLAKLYRNQEKILKAIKLLRNDD
jgi:hypothetical protein